MRLTLYRTLGLGQSTTQVQAMITSAAAQYPGVPNLSTVALGVAAHESGYIATAQNPGSSAAGVFQLISATQTTMGVTNPLDAQQNVNAGVQLLAQYYQTYGNWPQAIQAFSDGPGTVAAGTPPSAQTLGLESYLQNNYGLDLSGGAITSSDTSGDADTSGDEDDLMDDGGGTVDWGTVGLWAAVAGVAVLLMEG